MTYTQPTTHSTHFQGVSTLDELKVRYRMLCKTLHPDKGGTTEAMQLVNNAYEALTRSLITGAPRAAGAAGTEAEDIELEARLRVALEAISHLDGLEIEIVGRWIWVGGNTRPHKDAIKTAGYQWAHKKQMWYFQGVPSHSRGNVPMDEIRERYGSQRVKTYARAGLN